MITLNLKMNFVHVANHLRYSSSRSMELQLGIGIS